MWESKQFFFVLLEIIILVQFTKSQSTPEITQNKVCSGYGYQVWLSCIIDPCVFASCPAFGKLAECRKEISEDCKTCRAAFYLNGKRVNCHLRNIVCPPGLPLQQCASDPCTSTDCIDPKFKGAQCRGYYCGGCLAEYLVDGTWQQCPTPDVKLQGDAPLLLPEIRRAMIDFSSEPQSSSALSMQGMCSDGTPEPQCPDDVCVRAECPQFSRASCVVNKCQGCKPEFYFRGQLVNCHSTNCGQNVLEMSCPDDPCKYASCPLYPGAECRPSNCGYCHPEWFVNNTMVNCFSRMPDNYQCPNGLQQQECPRNTCRFRRCLTDASTFCRVNNCGGCFAEYVNTQNEIVDCVGWWTKYENKKPKDLTEVNSTPATFSQSNNNLQPVPLQKSGNINNETGTTRVEIKSAKVKEQEIDALFGDLGLNLPPNSEVVSSVVGSNIDTVKPLVSASDNNVRSTSLTGSSSIRPISSSTQDNVKQAPLDSNVPTKPSLIQPSQQDNLKLTPLETNVQMVPSIKSSAAGRSITAPSQSTKPDAPSTGSSKTTLVVNGLIVNKQATNQPPDTSIKRKGNVQISDGTNNMEQTQLPEPASINLFRSLSIPPDSNNRNSNFAPGIPIGAWNFRSFFK